MKGTPDSKTTLNNKTGQASSNYSDNVKFKSDARINVAKEILFYFNQIPSEDHQVILEKMASESVIGHGILALSSLPKCCDSPNSQSLMCEMTDSRHGSQCLRAIRSKGEGSDAPHFSTDIPTWKDRTHQL
jgi:hypothetical protein